MPGRERLFTAIVTFAIAAVSGHVMQFGMFHDLNRDIAQNVEQDFEPLPVRIDSRMAPKVQITE